MTLEALILVAIGLSFDAFGACVGRGAEEAQWRGGRALRTAAIFGCFALAAPLVGWAIGLALYDVVARYDHWVAFVLLGGVGLQMFLEARKGAAKPSVAPAYRFALLLVSAFATSVDAAVIGVTLPLLRVDVTLASAIIGAATFVASLVGLWLGRAGGTALGHRAEIVGGLLLMAIGTKILIEHTFFGVSAPGGSP